MPNSKTLLQTILAAFCAILCTHLCVGGGGMMIGARTAAWAKSGVQNLWVWPTEYAPNYGDRADPASIINPHVGMWQGSVASNGYIRNATRGSFTTDSVTTAVSSGYSMGIFIRLQPGDYRLTANCDKDSKFSTTVYSRVEDGYQNSGRTLSYIRSEGSVMIEFTVPDDSLILFRPAPNEAGVNMTTTNIVLIRI